MNFDPPPSPDSSDLLDLTSMVDVVFILLTFFVMTAQFMPQERDAVLGASQPVAASGASREDLPEAVIVQLLPGEDQDAPRIAVGQAVLPPGEYAAITATLQEIDIPELPVVLVADASLSVDQVSLALDAVMRSPMQRVSLTQPQPAAEPQ